MLLNALPLSSPTLNISTCFFFFFNDTATTEIYTLSLHDALPISPRRQELLRNAGIPFEVQPAHIPEDPLPGEHAKDYAERLAREKALAVAKQRPRDFVLGADTVVVVDGQILGKPLDAADAVRML